MPESQTADTQPDLATAAAEYRADNLRLRLLIDRAREVDDAASHAELARFALAMRRPALALRHARIAADLAPENASLVGLRKDAERLRHDVVRPHARGAELFVQALLDTIRETGPVEADAIPIETLNAALRKMSHQHGPALARDSQGRLRRRWQPGDPSVLEKALAEAHPGQPCGGCGAPRWLFVSGRVGASETCSVCGWPEPADRTPEAVQVKNHRQLRNQLDNLEAELAKARAERDAARSECKARDAKIERQGRTLAGLRRRPQTFARAGQAPSLEAAKTMAELDMDQLVDIAREGAALAAAALKNVEAAATEARRRQGASPDR